MYAILLTGYIVFLLIALIYSSIIIYHILKYHHEDLSPARTKHAQKVLRMYIIISGIILVVSIAAAIVLFILV